MIRPPALSHWSLFAPLRGWSRWERLAVVVPLTGSVVVGQFAGPQQPWLEYGLMLLAFAVFNVVVYRHGGWRLLGPHFYYDVVRLARRGRSTVLRVLYLAGLLLGLWLAYRTIHTETMRVNDFAAAAERFAFALFQVQNIAVLILTPAYLGSAIAEERERRTLEMIFTTQLSDTEIILGKLFSRLIHLAGFVLAGWPVLCLIQFWGGIDMLLIAGNLANTLLLIVSVGSFCLLLSTIMRSVTAAVLTSYAVLTPTVFCMVTALNGFPLVLQDARAGAVRILTIQDLSGLLFFHGAIAFLCLALAWTMLRGHEYFDVASLPERLPNGLLRQEIASAVLAARPAYHQEPGAEDVFAVPYELPPITEPALLWKERYVGGPPLLLSPIVWVPIVPFVLTGVALLMFWHIVSLADEESWERSRESWTILLRFFYYVFLGSFALGVSFRAAGSVVRERQQQTLEPLLLLPIDRRDILAAKWQATLIRGWPWLALIVGDILLGVWLGAYPLHGGVLLCLAPWPMIVFFASFGLLLSVLANTVLRAYLAMVVVIVAFVGCESFGSPLLTYMEAFVVTAPPQDEHPAARIMHGVVMMTIYAMLAAACWRIAVRRFEDRGRHGDA